MSAGSVKPNNRKTYLSRAVFSTLTALLVAFIFGNSAADGDASSELSLLVTQWLNSALEWMRMPLELSHHAVRKLAHFTEYSVLGALLTVTFWSWRTKPWRFALVWLPVVTGGAVAVLDEWLQTFVPERCGCVSDALLDLSGVVWAAAVVSVVLCRRQCAKNCPVGDAD